MPGDTLVAQKILSAVSFPSPAATVCGSLDGWHMARKAWVGLPLLHIILWQFMPVTVWMGSGPRGTVAAAAVP